MMRTTPICRIARVVVEAATPLSIGSGQASTESDAPIARDANALPIIPGTSIAGVLRHRYVDHVQAESGGAEAFGKADALFGYQQGAGGRASRLHVTHGHVLDAHGRAIDGLVLPEQISDDTVLSILADDVVTRDRVRLTDKGAAALHGKFDRDVCLQGTRFAFELRLWSTDDAVADDWDLLLGLVASSAFRLGGGTRAGLGALRVVRLHTARCDLRVAADAERYRQLPPALDAVDGLEPAAPASLEWVDRVDGRLQLQSTGYWRIGAGATPLRSTSRILHRFPLSESIVVYDDDQPARIKTVVRVPGSSIKGALAHRCAFHWRRLTGEFAYDESAPATTDERPAALEALFGSIKQDDGGQAGHLFIDDVALDVADVEPLHLHHNALDRFTGGVQNRKLFAEEVLVGGRMTVPLAIHHASALPDPVRQALGLALADLCSGRLPIGGGTSGGNGVFRGTVSDALAKRLDLDGAGLTAAGAMA